MTILETLTEFLEKTDPGNYVSHYDNNSLSASVRIAGRDRYCLFTRVAHPSGIHFLESSVALVQLSPEAAENFIEQVARLECEDIRDLDIYCADDGSLNWTSRWAMLDEPFTDCRILAAWLNFASEECAVLDRLVVHTLANTSVAEAVRPVLRLIHSKTEG